MQIYLHVGLPKTATTYFQSSVFPDISQSGFLYNPKSIVLLINQIIIENFSNYGNINQDLISRLHVALDDLSRSGVKKLLISSENMSCLGWNPLNSISGDLPALIKEMFQEAVILLLLRDPASWLISLYKHYLDSSGGPLNIRQFFDENETNKCSVDAPISEFPLNNSSLDWSKLVSQFEFYFNPENVFIYSYEEFRKNTALFVGRICTDMSVPTPIIKEQKRINKSPSALSCIIILVVGRLKNLLGIKLRSTRFFHLHLLRLHESKKSKSPFRFLYRLFVHLRYEPLSCVLRRFDNIIYIDWNILDNKTREIINNQHSVNYSALFECDVRDSR